MLNSKISAKSRGAFLFSLIFLQLPLGVPAATAAPLVCAVCSVGITSGLVLAKILGIEENVVALWFGATIFAMGAWGLYFLNKKQINSFALKCLAFFSPYLLLVIPFLGENPQLIFNREKVFFIDSFIFFAILGSVVVLLSEKYCKYIKIKNNRPHFSFEKVVLPMILLGVISLIISFLR
jgi:hypothetical protein